jgi:hypothetical protein
MHNSNRNKKVIYRSFVTNSYTNINSGSSFNALVNSGITHPTGILICPFIAATTGANSGFGDFQWKSPFDTCPSTLSPLSLTNLQIAIGVLSPADNTFSNTCPLMVNCLPGLLPTGTSSIVAGLYISKPPTTSFAGINLGSVSLSHPLLNFRLYYSQVTVDPQKSIDYVQRNRNKKVIYIQKSNLS